MMKQEFEERIGTRISMEDYQNIIEPVYNYYPEEKEGNKDLYAKLYQTFGIRIFKDMLTRAKKVEEIEIELRVLKQKQAEL